MKLYATLLAASLAFGCQSVPGRSLGARPEAPATLEQLLHEYSELTGHNLTYNQDTKIALAGYEVREVGPASTQVLLIQPATATAAQTAQFEVIALQYASAPNLAQTLQRLVMDASGGFGEDPLKILADNRTNSLLVSGSEARLDELKKLIVKLDTEMTAGG